MEFFHHTCINSSTTIFWTRLNIKNSEPTSDISKYQHQYAQMIFAALPTIWPVDLQTCLYIVEDYVNKHRCKITGTKSDVLRINTPNIEIDCWEICNQLIKETNSTIHLGIIRNTTGNIDIENLIQQGRRTLQFIWSRLTW